MIQAADSWNLPDPVRPVTTRRCEFLDAATGEICGAATAGYGTGRDLCWTHYSKTRKPAGWKEFWRTHRKEKAEEEEREGEE
jgi:hypothetical protein